jgi:hypothetical protein
MIGVFLSSFFRSCVLLCYFTPLVESCFFVGLLFFGVCGVLLVCVKAMASMKVQIYEMPPRFGREFVTLRRREEAVECTWVG